MAFIYFPPHEAGEPGADGGPDDAGESGAAGHAGRPLQQLDNSRGGRARDIR